MPAHVHIPGTWSTVLGTRGLLRELVIFVQEFNLYFTLSFTCSLPQSSLSGCLISLLSGDCLSLCSLCKKNIQSSWTSLGPISPGSLGPCFVLHLFLPGACKCTKLVRRHLPAALIHRKKDLLEPTFGPFTSMC